MRKQKSCLEKEILQGTMPGARRRGRPRTAWMDNIKTWTGLSVEESVRMTEDRDKWAKNVQGVANSRIEDSKRTEQNRMQRLARHVCVIRMTNRSSVDRLWVCRSIRLVSNEMTCEIVTCKQCKYPFRFFYMSRSLKYFATFLSF